MASGTAAIGVSVATNDIGTDGGNTIHAFLGDGAGRGGLVVVDAGNAAVRDEYQRLASEALSRRVGLLQSVGVDRVEVSTDASYIEPLASFFRTRSRRA